MNQICHYAPDRGRAICGIMPLWSSTTLNSVTGSECRKLAVQRSVEPTPSEIGGAKPYVVIFDDIHEPP